MTEKEHIEKLLAIEKNVARKSGFHKGVIIGMFIPILTLSIIMVSLILNKSYVEKKVGELVIFRVMTQVFSAFPDAYFTNNRERIIQIFDTFTNAASKHGIRGSDFNQIGREFLTALQDKQLTYAELDHILELMQESSK